MRTYHGAATTAAVAANTAIAAHPLRCHASTTAPIAIHIQPYSREREPRDPHNPARTID